MGSDTKVVFICWFMDLGLMYVCNYNLLIRKKSSFKNVLLFRSLWLFLVTWNQKLPGWSTGAILNLIGSGIGHSEDVLIFSLSDTSVLI